jgi:cytochrome P450
VTVTTGAAEILFDPLDPETRSDPYPAYRRLRERAPAWRSPEGVWYLVRYRDCADVFHSPAVTTTR